MPATNHQVERLSLTFRAESPAPRSVLPGGLVVMVFARYCYRTGWLVDQSPVPRPAAERAVAYCQVAT